MFAFKIISSEIKDFMNKLLREETFDTFEVRGVEILSFTKFEISGALDKDLLPQGENQSDARNFCTWREIRPYVFGLIKGGRRPKQMKVIFSLPPKQVQALHTNASAFFLNIMFDGTETLCTTATSEKNFSMDKSIDIVWEDYIQQFFKNSKIIISTHL